jgi:hypothetical protein
VLAVLCGNDAANWLAAGKADAAGRGYAQPEDPVEAREPQRQDLCKSRIAERLNLSEADVEKGKTWQVSV